MAALAAVQAMARLCRQTIDELRINFKASFVAGVSGLEVSNDWNERVFAFWFGEAMSDRRRKCFETLPATECTIHLVTEETLPGFVLADSPLHPAFPLLCATHKSDYLRAYFMHHHGGGYTDIKTTSDSWRPAFAALRASNAFGAGYTEVPYGVGTFHVNLVNGQCFYLDYRVPLFVARKLFRHHDRNHRKLLGNGAFIYRPRTKFTKRWLATVEWRLDILHPYLAENPAKFAQKVPGQDFGLGPSRYPVPWTFLLGDILAPLVMRHRNKVLHVVPPPSFTNYR